MWLSGTNITGTMPAQLCHIAQNIHYLDITVDCGGDPTTSSASENDPYVEIQCDCCNCFGAPPQYGEASGDE